MTKNVYYTVIPMTSDVIVNYLSINCASGGIVTIRATIDGATLTASCTPAGVITYIYLNTASDVLNSSSTITAFNQITPEYARNFMVEVENTNGTQAITGVMRWNSL